MGQNRKSGRDGIPSLSFLSFFFFSTTSSVQKRKTELERVVEKNLNSSVQTFSVERITGNTGGSSTIAIK